MMASIFMFSTIFLITYYLLRNIFFTEWIFTVAISFIAWITAYILMDIIGNLMPKRNVDPEGKAVFVTGCGSGFGFELVKKLDNLGFYVYAGCLSPDTDGAKLLKSSCSKRLKIIKVDVTNDEQVAEAAKEVKATLNGKILLSVVNNAGITTYSEIEWCSLDIFNKLLDVNVMGAVKVTKAFLPLLQESEGRIVITASVSGRFTFPGLVAYAMSKHAVVSFADGLRREMAKWNISVHTIEPFLHKTRMTDTNNLINSLQQSWAATTAEIKETYGLKYYHAYEKCLSDLLSLTSPTTDEVINDLADASIGITPKNRYVPNLLFRVSTKCFQLLPDEILDLIFNLCVPSVLPAKKSVAHKKISSLTMNIKLLISRSVLAVAINLTKLYHGLKIKWYYS